MEDKRVDFVHHVDKRVDIEFQNVTYTAKGGKQIIKGISGKFLSGELTAIMGPSGAGKTSLLNILTGFRLAGTKGDIKCRTNDEWKSGALAYKKDSCYILQDDNLTPLFTVQELMDIVVKLKLKNITRKEADFLIDNVLEELGLSKCRNVKSQNLSGGQRKRLSIALELTGNPPIMFLDEPTTGLDSLSTTQCVQKLKELAQAGRTIVCTIHQPSASVYELFDHVYVVADGKCVYQGASTNTISYLSSLGFNCPKYHNPADYFLEVVCDEYKSFTDLLSKAATDTKWRRAVPKIEISEKNTLLDRDQTIIYPCEDSRMLFGTPTELLRFWVLVKKLYIQQFKDWTVTHLKLLLHILVGVFLGVTFQNSGTDASKVINNLGFFLCNTVYLAFTSLMPAVLKFPSEISILKKERFNNWYKLKTYYLASMVTDIPVQIAFSFWYTVMAYFISAQPYELMRFVMVVLIQLLVALCASGWGFILGTFLNPVNGTFWGSISLALMICLGGFLIFFPHMAKVMYIMTYFNFISFALEAIMQAIYGYNRENLSCPEEVEFCLYTDPVAVLHFLGMDKNNYWNDVAYLFGAFILFRIVAYFTLKKRLASE